MKVSGSAVLHAPRERVWAALNDPAVLVRTIPGCRRLESTGPDDYRMTVSAGVGTIKGTYDGEVRLHSRDEPSSFVMTASGAGAPGTVSTDVLVRLSEDGAGVTRLSYDADAIVGGMIGGVGQRMLSGVAKKTASEFFAAVDDVLTSATTAPAPVSAVSGGTTTAETQVYEAPQVPHGLAWVWATTSDLASSSVRPWRWLELPSERALPAEVLDSHRRHAW